MKSLTNDDLQRILNWFDVAEIWGHTHEMDVDTRTKIVQELAKRLNGEQLPTRDGYSTDNEESDRRVIMNNLYSRVFNFMIDNDVTCIETISQCDWVIENAYGLIEDLFGIIKADLPITDDKE